MESYNGEMEGEKRDGDTVGEEKDSETGAGCGERGSELGVDGDERDGDSEEERGGGVHVSVVGAVDLEAIDGVLSCGLTPPCCVMVKILCPFLPFLLFLSTEKKEFCTQLHAYWYTIDCIQVYI